MVIPHRIALHCIGTLHWHPFRSLYHSLPCHHLPPVFDPLPFPDIFLCSLHGVLDGGVCKSCTASGHCISHLSIQYLRLPTYSAFRYPVLFECESFSFLALRRHFVYLDLHLPYSLVLLMLRACAVIKLLALPLALETFSLSLLLMSSCL